MNGSFFPLFSSGNNNITYALKSWRTQGTCASLAFAVLETHGGRLWTMTSSQIMRQAERVFEIQIKGDKMNQKWYNTKQKIDALTAKIEKVEEEIAAQQKLRIKNSAASKAGGINAIKMSDVKIQKEVGRPRIVRVIIAQPIETCKHQSHPPCTLTHAPFSCFVDIHARESPS